MRKESRGRVKKICIRLTGWVHVGNNLIVDNYYTTQRLNTAKRTCRKTVSISYIIQTKNDATVTKSRMVWDTCGIDGGHEFDRAVDNVTRKLTWCNLF